MVRSDPGALGIQILLILVVCGKCVCVCVSGTVCEKVFSLLSGHKPLLTMD